ncbi:MAG: hypothetical protein Q9175_000474 [Cornicularia normoerica]
MAHSFTHSRVVIRQLAQATARTPPSEEDPPFEYVDRSLTILGRSSNIHSERLRHEFLSQREFIATQIKEVEIKIDGRFREMEIKMDGRFKEMDGRFKDVEKRFEEADKKIDRHFKEVDKKVEGVDKKMRDYLNLIQNASRNYLRTRGWEAISPVGSLDPQGGMHLPEYFPRTIRHFWRLRDSSQSKLIAPNFTEVLEFMQETVDRLIHLIRFYKIQGYEEWGRDTDSLEGYIDSDDSSEESSESSRLPIPLEVAVRSNPDIAHRALGAQLGLAYDEIQRFMERAKELSQVQIMRNKRGQEEEASEDRRKRSFKMSPEGTEVTSPTEPQSSQGR